MPSKDACPCCSGRLYRDCCRPYHRGEREPPDPEALMRSRYAAFAKQELSYLWRTLHERHPDRASDEAEAAAELRDAIRAFKYTGLTILDTRPADEEGIARVLFHARVFDKGRELSFVELSQFLHDGTGWRYLRGEPLAVSRLPVEPDRVDIDTFRDVVARAKAAAARR